MTPLYIFEGNNLKNDTTRRFYVEIFKFDHRQKHFALPEIPVYEIEAELARVSQAGRGIYGIFGGAKTVDSGGWVGVPEISMLTMCAISPPPRHPLPAPPTHSRDNAGTRLAGGSKAFVCVIDTLYS